MVKKQSEIVTQSKDLMFNPETVELIKKTVAKDATDEELQLFLYQASKTKLDPLARQIYFMKRRTKKENGDWESKVSIQTSIDGFRVVAERSGKYAGQDEPKFDEGAPYPRKCVVTIYKFDEQGVRYQASHGVAYWSEYFPQNDKQNFMWKKMPHTMLSKVAEALALRKAFPQDLSGLYTTEEMEQIEDTKEIPVQPKVHEEKKVEEGKVIEPEKAKFTEADVPREDATAIVADAVDTALENDNPQPNDHTCHLHQFKGVDIAMKDRGKGIWDHRSRLNDKFEYDPQGKWYHCQGKGWKLASIQ